MMQYGLILREECDSAFPHIRTLVFLLISPICPICPIGPILSFPLLQSLRLHFAFAGSLARESGGEMRCESDKMYVFIPEMHQKCQKKVKKRDKMWGGCVFS